jgi:molybdopterin molybdotransferase
MTQFLKLVGIEEAKRRLFDALSETVTAQPSERISSDSALNRVLAEAVMAPERLPPFNRSTVDGYAVRAEDTFGASASLPCYLEIAGEVPMGAASGLTLNERQAALVHTGGMMPAEADAVVMLEDTQSLADSEIEVHRPVARAENVLRAGEDLEVGQVALEKGQRLRAQELGGLAALGVTEVSVVSRPCVAIIATGDEVVTPSARLEPGQVRDVNSAMLTGLVTQAGGLPQLRGIIPDDETMLLSESLRAMQEADVIVITAGSSVSVRDRTANVLGKLGAPGVLVHGVSMKPGKPTIIAVCEGKLAIGLPGNPVSALVAAGVFLAPVIRFLLGERGPDLQPFVEARLAVNVASKAGREDYLPVRLEPSGDNWLAQPVYGRSNLVFTLARADGLAHIPPETTGLPLGSVVRVQVFG